MSSTASGSTDPAREPARAGEGTAYWIRLAASPEAAGPPPDDASEVRARLGALLGCRWVWWVSDPDAAWSAVLETCGVGSHSQVLIPIGAAPQIERAVRARRAALVEVDLDPHAGWPQWVPVLEQRRPGPYVCILDHRHGLPSRPPAHPGDGLVIEDATDAVGGDVSRRPVGSLGSLAVVTLGTPPFARSRGAVIATNQPKQAEALALRPEVGNLPSDASGDLWADLIDVPDWVEGCRAAARVYSSAWRPLGLPLRPVEPAPGTAPTCSGYLVAVPDPDSLHQALAAQGIETRRPLNDRIVRLLHDPAGAGLAGARAFYERVLQLPNHPGLDMADLLYVADAVRRHLAERPRG